MNDQTNGSDQAGRGDWSLGSSWVTLGALVLVIFVLSRVSMVTGSPALAEITTRDGAYTMMTTDGGSDEILVLVDSREEMISVYRVNQTGNGLDLIERESLSGLFSRARAQAMGGP